MYIMAAEYTACLEVLTVVVINSYLQGYNGV
jgi:hypothetical protein